MEEYLSDASPPLPRSPASDDEFSSGIGEEGNGGGEGEEGYVCQL